MLGRELGAAEIGELLGMDLDRQPLRLRRREDPRGLLGREGDALAEDVDRIGQALRGDRVEHRPGDEIDIVARAALELRRHRMGAEEGGAHR